MQAAAVASCMRLLQILECNAKSQELLYMRTAPIIILSVTVLVTLVMWHMQHPGTDCDFKN